MSDNPVTVLPDTVVTAKAPTPTQGPPPPQQAQQTPAATPNMSFTQKLINITIQLGTGSFGLSGFDTVTLSGLRTSCEIMVTGMSSTTLQARIHGMTPSLQNQLSTLGIQPQTGTMRRNLISITAGDATGMSSVFLKGIIFNAFFEASQAPQTAFYVLASATSLAQMQPVAPTSFSGGTPVAAIMSGLAKQIGATFENNNVTTTLSNPYFPGTAWHQIEACANHANIGYALDPASNTLAIWPLTSARGGSIPLVSPDTGMIGYPTLQPSGLIVNTLFNPSIKIGGQIKVQSSLPQANGTWQVSLMDHQLESMQPGGRWQTQLTVLIPGTVAPSAA